MMLYGQAMTHKFMRENERERERNPNYAIEWKEGLLFGLWFDDDDDVSQSG